MVVALKKPARCVVLGTLLSGWALTVQAQIDPAERRLLEVGYQQSFEGHAPLAGYAYYYWNQPGVWQTNMTLRLAIAPVYLDSELGIAGVLTPHTDLGLGISGGGYAYSYNEIRQGKYYLEDSFFGSGAGASLSLYHLFNPQALIPLTAVLRGGFHYQFYNRDDTTAASFAVPHDQVMPTLRAGLRWGGQEPVLSPDLAFELSGWYESQFRLDPGVYGYNDRELEPLAHLFWARAGLIYTMPELKHKLNVNLTGGWSVHPDRFSAYRLGGMFSLASEFPFALPGYYFNELSARNFVLMATSYTVPLDAAGRWAVTAGAASARLAYTPGLEQPNDWNSGVGANFSYTAPSKTMTCILAYGYGIDAMRSQGRGANSVALLLQFNFEKQPAGGPNQNTFDRGSFLQRLIHGL